MGIDVLGFAEASEFEGYALKYSSRRDPRISLPEAKTLVVAGIYIGGFTLPSRDKHRRENKQIDPCEWLCGGVRELRCSVIHAMSRVSGNDNAIHLREYEGCVPP